MDLLLACGEQIAVSMVGPRPAVARHSGGVADGDAVRIHTDGSFNRARIHAVETRRLVSELQTGRVVIVAGFQGVTGDQEVTTLGRGGGDITGAALAAALQASVYENCTDVDGVYTADPGWCRRPADSGTELRGMHRAGRQRRKGVAPARGRDLYAV